ncbi:MAG: permease [Planctomycetota bacterium]|nr:permease [Planctomycetota bacterium]
MSQILYSIWQLLCQMAPYLLFGFLLSAILYAIFPPSIIIRYTGKGIKSIFVASFIGAPLPLCSCSVLPMALTLKQRGASPGATASFLIATPITSVDSIAVTYAFFGALFATYRVVASLIISIIVGITIHFFSHSTHTAATAQNLPCQYCDLLTEHKHRLKERLLKGFFYGFFKLPSEIDRWILLGILIGGILSALLPADIVSQYAGKGLLPLFIMLGVGIPLYVCSTGSTPLAAALVSKGFSPGSALVFLLVGPATNIAALLSLWRILGRKFVLLYLLSLMLSTLFVAYFYDAIFKTKVTSQQASLPCHATVSEPLFNQLSGISLLLLLLIIHIVSVFRRREGKEETSLPCACGEHHTAGATDTEISVPDMKCKACEAAVTLALKSIKGVENVKVDILNKIVKIHHKDEVSKESLLTALRQAGYQPREKDS